MQKKIIALAVASAMTVPAVAFADVSVSGQANMSIDMRNSGTTTGSETNNQLTSNQSRLIFKGSEDLGGGLSGVVQLDTRFNLDTGTIGATATTASLFSGNTYLGLKSDAAGTLMLGNLDTPYKTATRNLDVFFDVAGDNRSALGGLMGAHDVRLPNSIAYVSPSMSGFSVAISSVFGGETPTVAAANKKGSLYSLAGMYKTDSIFVSLAYDDMKVGDTGTGDLGASTALGAVDSTAKALKVGGGYTAEAFTVNAIYEAPSNKTAAGAETKNTNMYLGGKFNISATDAIKLAYTSHGETTSNSVKMNDAASQIALGYDHSMSKATSVYVNYVKTTSDPGYNAGTGTSTAGADPSVLSFGVKHAF
jgi:predicted porin